MKKIIIKLLSLSILVLCLTFMLISCGKELETPTGLTLDIETMSIRWNKVIGAKSYTIHIPGEERDKTTKQNHYSLDHLAAGTYEIKIKANGDVGSGDESDWLVYTFERPVESGLKYSLINNDTEYAVTGGGDVEGEVVIEDYYRGKPVTMVGDKAFYNNSKVTKITVGKNVTKIGEKSFSKASKLTEIVLPEGLLKIGNYAFQGCKAIESIEIPSTVTEIPSFMFSLCENLKTVKLGDNVTTIKEYAFSDCKALATINMPTALSYVAPYAFSSCHSIPALDFKSISVIDDYAFYDCASLASISFGGNLKHIHTYAFGKCPALTALTIPDSVERIDAAAFMNCANLETAKLGAGIIKLESQIFNGTKLYEAAEEVFYIDSWFIEAKNKEIESITLPEGIIGLADFSFSGCKNLLTIDFKGVKYIGRAAFYNCKVLWEVIFDNSLIVVGENAFRNCEGLTSVNLKNNLTTIESYAFMGCMRLYNFDIPDTVTKIGGYAFNGTAKHITTWRGPIYVDDWVVGVVNPANFDANHYPEITISDKDNIRGIADYSFYGIPILYTYIPDSVEIIGKGAFYGGAYNTTIRLPKNLKYIGDYAFYGCQSAWFNTDEDGKLIIPSTTEYIGRSAFYNCQSIISLQIPGSVKTIGKYAFYNCVSLGDSELAAMSKLPAGKITIGEGVKSIGDQAFRNCTSISNIALPNSLTYLGQKAFMGCTKLTNVSVGLGLENIENYTFYKCEGLQNVAFTSNLKSIGAYAFTGCKALTTINLERVETIGTYAFANCMELKEIVIPDSMTSIENHAFRGCNAITSVIIPDSVTAIGKHAFYGVNNATLFVESAELGKNWSKLFNSSNRPVVLGCKLSEDGKHVVSVTKGAATISNSVALNGVSAPKREGYIFEGWVTTPVNDYYENGAWVVPEGATVYAAKDIKTAPDGTLYAVWVKAISE